MGIRPPDMVESRPETAEAAPGGGLWALREAGTAYLPDRLLVAGAV
jgi:hypothetical protein